MSASTKLRMHLYSSIRCLESQRVKRTIMGIVSGLCLIAFGLFWGSAIKKEFIFGGAAIAALGGWLLVETRI
jgi:hypothetical protein